MGLMIIFIHYQNSAGIRNAVEIHFPVGIKMELGYKESYNTCYDWEYWWNK